MFIFLFKVCHMFVLIHISDNIARTDLIYKHLRSILKDYLQSSVIEP